MRAKHTGFPAQIAPLRVHCERAISGLAMSEAGTLRLPRTAAQETTFAILFAVSFCHLLNDMMQSLLPAIYPALKTSYHLSFTQIGLVTLTFQLTASLLQPAV